MAVTLAGTLQKMPATLTNSRVSYQLAVGDELIDMNDCLGRTFNWHYTGAIFCRYCGRKTRKSFQQGHCYPCFKRLARCDICMVSPEKCHYEQGTCREPEWAQGFCMNDHIVYLANASGAKVGITRASQLPTRWIDQGASQALPIYRVSTRYQAGLVETVYKNHIADKTHWQAMLKSEPEPVDLPQLAIDLAAQTQEPIEALQAQWGLQAITPLSLDDPFRLTFPIERHPQKVRSINLDKSPAFSRTLTGVKGQYCLFGDHVINLRKFAGYEVTISIT